MNQDLQQRAQAIKLAIFDVDGVLLLTAACIF